jgi:hypothetical protein
MQWACDCAEHVLHLYGNAIDERLMRALHVAREWKHGSASVGEARKAAVDAHAATREAVNPIAITVARCVGHAAATAHMADHCLGAAWYALRAVKAAGESIDAEMDWQNDQLPGEIADLVLSARSAAKFQRILQRKNP